MNKQEKLKRLHDLSLVREAALKLTKKNRNPEDVQECKDLGVQIKTLTMAVKKNKQIDDSGMSLLHDAPLLAKMYHVVPTKGANN